MAKVEPVIDSDLGDGDQVIFSDRYLELINLYMQEPTHPMTDPLMSTVEYHRLQLERWLYEHREDMEGPVVDIGAEFRHQYIPDLIVANHHVYGTEYVDMEKSVNLLASVTALPFQTASLGTVICLETFEHVFNIFRAMSEISRVLKPGGVFFGSTPFFWPTHGNANFADYWRITRQGWVALLLSNSFTNITITAAEYRAQSQIAMMQVSKSEVYGDDGEKPTGYFIQAYKK